MLRVVGLAFLVLGAAAASTLGEEKSDEKVQITSTGGVEKASRTGIPFSLKKIAKLSFLAALVGVGGADARTRPRAPLDRFRDDATRTKHAVLNVFGESMRGPGGVHELYSRERTVWDRSKIPDKYHHEYSKALYLLGYHENTVWDLRTAYRRAAKESHPDKNRHRVDETTELFRQVQDAYDLLKLNGGYGPPIEDWRRVLLQARAIVELEPEDWRRVLLQARAIVEQDWRRVLLQARAIVGMSREDWRRVLLQARAIVEQDVNFLKAKATKLLRTLVPKAKATCC